MTILPPPRRCARRGRSRPRPSASARRADDLRDAGSKTIKAADHVSLLGKIKIALGLAGGAGAAAEKGGVLETAQQGIDKASQAKGIWQSACDLFGPLFGNPAVIAGGVLLIASGIVVYLIASKVIAHRVADHNSGVHAGPAVEA
jgi:hypothetical protein